MGIRISKKIGYFLNNAQVKRLCVQDMDSAMDMLDQGDNLDFASRLLHEMEHHKDSSGQADVYISSWLRREYEAAFKAQLSATDFVHTVYFYDTCKGLMLQTMDQHKLNRHDDNIDYYENPMKNSINHLNRSLYPFSGYVYQGGMESLFPRVIKSSVVDGIVAAAMVRNFAAQKKSKQNDSALPDAQDTATLKRTSSKEPTFRQIVASGCFTPNIDPMMYLIAKAAGILKPSVTREIFDAQVRPVITTTWG